MSSSGRFFAKPVSNTHLPAEMEFKKRMEINRGFIKTLPGFVENAAYERRDERENLIVVTVAIWQDEASYLAAKESVQAAYTKENFDPKAMMEKLHISVDRGAYKQVLPIP